jgi:tetratricopeptide (TPR) repeat protein
MVVLLAVVLAGPTPPNVPLEPVESGSSCGSKVPAAIRAFNSGLNAEDAGDPAAAERLYKQAIDLDATFCDAFDHLGRLARRAGKLDQAVDWYRKSVAINPYGEVARTNLIGALLLQRKPAEAAAEVERALQRTPGSAELQYSGAMAYLSAGEPRKSVACARRAAELYAKERPELVADARLVEGVADFALHDCAAARAVLAGIEKEKGDLGDFNYVLGVCLVDDHRQELDTGVSADTPWVEQVRRYLRKAKAGGKEFPATLARAFQL